MKTDPDAPAVILARQARIVKYLHAIAWHQRPPEPFGLADRERVRAALAVIEKAKPAR